MPINPESIVTDHERNFETDGERVFARFRASVVVEISREELMTNPRAADEAKVKLVALLAAKPEDYAVATGQRSTALRFKDL